MINNPEKGRPYPNIYDKKNGININIRGGNQGASMGEDLIKQITREVCPLGITTIIAKLKLKPNKNDNYW